LYLVANALETKPRIPVVRELGVPLLGLERCVRADTQLQALFKTEHAEHVIGPNNLTPGSARACGARNHGDFDNDAATVQAAFQRITGGVTPASQLQFHRSAAALRERRTRADQTPLRRPQELPIDRALRINPEVFALRCTAIDRALLEPQTSKQRHVLESRALKLLRRLDRIPRIVGRE
jgi:hypothetical protein